MEESSKKDDSKCPKCGFTKFEIKDTTGQKSCMQCGYILENYGVVNDVSFNKDGGGGSTLNATFISSEHNAGTTDYHKAFGYRNYRQQIERSAKQKIDSCCNRLGCTAIAEPALQYFKMALINKHTRGRKVEYTIGACLYLACRQNTRPFMLIDFADELDIDVFHLGKAYQILADRLELKERYSIDPTIYIERLVKKLDFKEHSDEVREMAVRLVKRMKKDWIDKGRRPTGLCGAAILMAAKAQDFQICFQDISRVAKIGHATIKKRLSEFESTNASNLSINEFNKIGDGIEDFGEESHPPSFKHDIEDQIEKTFEHQSQVKDNILKLAEMFDKEIESAGNKQSKYSKAGSVVGDSENVNVKSERSVTDSEVDSRKQRVPEIQPLTEDQAITLLTDFDNPETTLLANQNLITSNSTAGSKPRLRNRNSENNNEEDFVLQESLQPTLKDYGVLKSVEEQFLNLPDLTEEPRKKRRRRGEKNSGMVTLSVSKENSVENSPNEENVTPPNENAQEPEKIKTSVNFQDPQNQNKEQDKIPEGPLSPSFIKSLPAETFSDIDDDEIDQYILPAEDVKVKTKIWEKENGKTYEKVLAAEKKKLLDAEKKKKEESDRVKQGIIRKKRKNRPASGYSNTGIAIAEVIKQNKLSKKIDYNKLVDCISRNYGESSSSKDSKSKNPTKTTKEKISDEKATENPQIKNPNSVIPWTPATPSEFPDSNKPGYSSASEEDTEDEEDDLQKELNARYGNDEDSE